MEISRKMWTRNFYGGPSCYMQIRCFRYRLFDGNIPILKEEIHTVILIPLWLCPGGGGARGIRWPTYYNDWTKITTPHIWVKYKHITLSIVTFRIVPLEIHVILLFRIITNQNIKWSLLPLEWQTNVMQMKLPFCNGGSNWTYIPIKWIDQRQCRYLTPMECHGVLIVGSSRWYWPLLTQITKVYWPRNINSVYGCWGGLTIYIATSLSLDIYLMDDK